MPLFTVGVDLGTTNSSVAYSVDDKINIVKNGNGNTTTPSFVRLDETEAVVGEISKNEIYSNLNNTIYDLKRLIGRKCEEKAFQEFIKTCNFKIIDENNYPRVRIKLGEVEKDFAPYEVTKYLIEEMIKYSVKETGIGVDETKNAVIATPSYFTDSQRSETRKSCELAGLNILRIIEEPISIAIAFGYKKEKDKSNKRILIFDYGGGSLDVSIVEVKDNEISIKATNSSNISDSKKDDNSNLNGGEKIDLNLVNYYSQRLYVVSGKYILKDKKELSKLKNACEEAKIALSEMNEVNVKYDMLEENGISSKLTREVFNRINEKDFRNTIEMVEKTLKKCKLTKDDIDDVLLVGGCSKIPKIVDLANEYFSGRNIYTKCNINGVEAEEVIAAGCAMLAEELLKGCEERTYPNGAKIIIDSKTGGFVSRANNIEPPEGVIP